jgi:SAM-dependent methyltransferase/uncharacterized coiled-coil DUF342 family protein
MIGELKTYSEPTCRTNEAMTSPTPIDVTEIMRGIRERVRQNKTFALPFAFPGLSLPLSTALHNARASLSELKRSAEQIDQLPPQPKTIRGSIGGFLSRLVRRLLFWQYAQARSMQAPVIHAVEQLILASEAISSHNQQMEATFRSVPSNIKRLTESSEQLETAMSVASKTIVRSNEHIERLSKENDRLRADLNSAIQRVAELSNTLAAITEQVDCGNQSTQAIQNEITNLADLRSQDSKQLTERVIALDRYAIRTRRNVLLQERRITSLLSSVRKYPQPIQSLSPRDSRNTFGDDSMADLYLALEDAFRGSPDDIAERVSEYLPILEQAGLKRGVDLVIDIGCGRGEWLRVLSQYGYSNKGCDSNESMIATCLEQGLEATQEDALQFLRSLSDNSVAAVTAFHVIEHLSLSAMLALIDESLRVLRPDGLLILETPNPQNVLVASHNFYVDPTHQKPVPMILLQFIVEERGFCEVRPLPLHPYPDSARVDNSSEVAQRFNEYFYGPQDYAVLAKKP